MKLNFDESQKYKIYIDGELFNSPKKIIFSVDTTEGIVKYIFTTDHFPYWPSTEYGELKLERINE